MKPGLPTPGGAAGAQYEVTELFSGDDDGLLWLTLGFASPAEPLDVLHIACGASATGVAEEDALYLERTDQNLACSGQVLALTVHDGCVALSLTPAGAAALGLPLRTGFTFNEHPALFTQAVAQLGRMAACGQSCIAMPGTTGDA